MTDDWKKLGDVVKGITDRLEGEIIARAPLPDADVALFVRLLSGELLAESAKPDVVRRKEGQGG